MNSSFGMPWELHAIHYLSLATQPPRVNVKKRYVGMAVKDKVSVLQSFCVFQIFLSDV